MKTPRLNTQTIFAVLTLLLSFTASAASQWYLPSGLFAVRIQNPTANMVRMYLSGASEEMLEVTGQSMITYNLSTNPVQGFHLLRTDDGSPLVVTVSYDGKSYARAFRGRASDLELTGHQKDESAEVIVTNISQVPLEVLVNQYHLKLARLEQKKLTLTWAQKSSIRIHSDYPVAAYAVVNNQIVSFSGRAKSLAQVSKNSGYFLMAGNTSLDSFVVKIDDPELVKSARDQIHNPKSAQTLIAQITWGSGGYNQDLLSPYKANWSWSVSKVVGFGNSQKSCDGTPSFVENYLPSWIQASKPICFSGYKVVQEL